MRSPLVLLVEDEALIALVLADDVETAGYDVAGPFNRASDTLAELAPPSVPRRSALKAAAVPACAP